MIRQLVAAVALTGLPIAAVAQPRAVTATSATEAAESLIDVVRKEPVGLLLSTDEHLGRMLGDRLPVAMAVRYRLRDLSNIDNARRALVLLGYSFWQPEFIVDEADSKPAVALLLLDYLAERGPDTGVQLRAKDLAAQFEPLRTGAVQVQRMLVLPPIPDDASERLAKQADAVTTAWFQAPAGSDLASTVQLGRVLGDRLAVGVARRFRLQDLQDPSTAKRTLSLLRYGFSAATAVADANDNTPAVTLLLLDYLADSGPDGEIRIEAKDLADRLEPLRAKANQPVAK